MDKAELIGFEDEVAVAFEAKRIRAPVHLAGGNEDELIRIFHGVQRIDWVFSTYRSHYHALLHGIPRDWLMAEILAGRSMAIMSREYRFFSSAIVGGTLSIAVGVAQAMKRAEWESKVWCFVGDMTATTGAFHEANLYARGHDLPIRFVVEDNAMSCDTPTEEAWGYHDAADRKITHYQYTRNRPHINTGKWVQF